jgi:hypothetical protein
MSSDKELTSKNKKGGRGKSGRRGNDDTESPPAKKQSPENSPSKDVDEGLTGSSKSTAPSTPLGKKGSRNSKTSSSDVDPEDDDEADDEGSDKDSDAGGSRQSSGEESESDEVSRDHDDERVKGDRARLDSESVKALNRLGRADMPTLMVTHLESHTAITKWLNDFASYQVNNTQVRLREGVHGNAWFTIGMISSVPEEQYLTVSDSTLHGALIRIHAPDTAFANLSAFQELKMNCKTSGALNMAQGIKYINSWGALYRTTNREEMPHYKDLRKAFLAGIPHIQLKKLMESLLKGTKGQRTVKHMLTTFMSEVSKLIKAHLDTHTFESASSSSSDTPPKGTVTATFVTQVAEQLVAQGYAPSKDAGLSRSARRRANALARANAGGGKKSVESLSATITNQPGTTAAAKALQSLSAQASSRQKTGVKTAKAGVIPDKDKTCFGCGHRGHGRNTCPHKEKAGFMAYPNQASKPISLH